MSRSPFEYSECLTSKTLHRIPDKLKISGSGDSCVLLIVRLLSGALKVKHISSEKSFNQKDNFFTSSFQGISQIWDRQFPRLIGENYSIEQFSKYVEGTKFKNITFYKNILCEISYFFLYQNKGNYSGAFVFLYRALEHSSYAFPLIYASKTGDFTRTYTFLKQLMSGDKNAGELAFLKSFLKTVYSSDSISESDVDFPILLETEAAQNEAFDLLRGFCSDDMIAESTVSPRLLTIRYMDVGSFIITIRNRFFHYLNGGPKNIDSSSISDIEILFFLVNKKCLYWFSTILLAIISHGALEFEKIKASA